MALSLWTGVFSTFAATEYSIGDVNGEEQYAIELINRARMMPSAEAPRILPQAVKNGAKSQPKVVDAFWYFGVDGNQFATQMAAYQPVPPVAPNKQLMATSRNHTTWMFNTTLQEHDEQPNAAGGNILERIIGGGYQGAQMAENIYTQSENTYYSHLAFEVDWGDSFSGGGSAYGMQVPPGHRMNIHNADMREIGIGLYNGTKMGSDGWPIVGPQVGTQQFARSHTNAPFLTGVVYVDRNGSGDYDPGEGIPGVKVEAEGADYYAVTASGGGYAIPLAKTNRSYSVRFSGQNVSYQTTVHVTNLANVKADYVQASWLPTLSAAAGYLIGIPSNIAWNSVIGASGYKLFQGTKTNFTGTNCDSLTGVTTAVGSYTLGVLQSTIKDGAGSAWHLCHTSATQADQTITFNGTYTLASNAAISFRSRLAAAYDNQQARVQFSTDEGITWQDVWSQIGATPDGNAKAQSGETAFNSRSIDAAKLSPFVNRLVKIRFNYTYTQVANGYYVSSSGNTSGWFIDNIVMTGISAVSGQETTLTSNSLVNTPIAGATGLYAIKPIINGSAIGWPYGPIFEPSPTLPTGYSAWALQAEVVAKLPIGSLSINALGDADSDGVSNLLEYALGTNPGSSSSKPPVNLERTVPSGARSSNTDNSLVLSYTRNLNATDVAVSPQGSIDLKNWFTPGQVGAPFVMTESVVSTAGSTQSRQVSVTTTPSQPVYLRLKASR